MSETPRADEASLRRIFTVPEAPDSTLGRIDREITEDLATFLNRHIVAVEHRLDRIEADFADPHIPDNPTFVSDYTEFLKEKLVAHSVNTASPGFVGHMTSAIPYFMLPIARMLTALNQNLVKVETSKAFTPLERQVLAMLHHLVYGESDEFYARWMHDPTAALGAMCSGGTLANVTALWVARNRIGHSVGIDVAADGVGAAAAALGVRGFAVVVSRRGHYSLQKSVDVLGIGRHNLVAVDTDTHHHIDIPAVRRELQRLSESGVAPLAVVGVAGTTETGSVDDLDALADICEEARCHFHVDAAWGGPTLFSQRYRTLLRGIERADSVTIDAHKQLYVPMGAGMVLFKDPMAVRSIEFGANYIIRAGSKDLGSHTLEGSRPGNALLVHAGLSVIGKKGYELLIDRGIERAHHFASLIRASADFDIASEPELNICTYRYIPADVQDRLIEAGRSGDRATLDAIAAALDTATESLQKAQREAGRTFVSRTRLPDPNRPGADMAVFRVVLANPLTTDDTLVDVLDEQRALARELGVDDLIRAAS